MSEKFSPAAQNSYADWGGGDLGPRQFKHKNTKNTWDDAVKSHNKGRKPRRDDQRAIERASVATQPDDELSIFAGDQTLAKEIANKDGRTGEAIGEREVQRVVDDEPKAGTVIQPEPTSSSVQALPIESIQRRVNTRRLKRSKPENRTKDSASTFGTKTVDRDVMQPATYSDDQLFGPTDYPATYSDGQTFGTSASPASYSDSQTFGPNELPATYSDDQLFGPTDYPATYSDGQTFGTSASPASYSDDEFMGPTKLGAPTRSQSRQVRELIASDAYKAAHNHYGVADGELAGKVARRLKLGMFASKKTRETASAEVEAARLVSERTAEMLDAIQIEKWKLNDPAISDQEISHKLANFHEAKLRLQGLRGQYEITTSTGKFGKLSELNNKATEWFAGLSRKQKVAVGIGSVVVGAGAGLVVAAAGTVLGAGAGMIGAGLLAGAKVYKTSAQGRAGLHRNTVEVDKDDFKNADGSYKSIDELRVQSSESFKKGLDQRVEKADKINKKAKWMTIASAALLGAGVAGHIDAVHDAYKAAEGGIADYFGLTDHHDVLPSGGSGARNPADLGSGDVNPHNQYTFTHHDVAPAPVTPVEVVPQDMGGATEFSGAGLDHFNQWANGHTVQPGESVWKLSQDYLQANGVRNPSVYQIDAVKDKVLAEFSAKGLVDGQGWLTAGQQLRIK